MPESSCGEIIHYSHYSISFCKDRKLSEWSIYLLTSNLLNSDPYPRSNNFRQDPNLNGSDARTINYKFSGYDRGHLVPAGDMSFISEIAMSESFYMTNIVPENPGFNRGAKRRVEKQIRDWTIEFDSLVIITGIVFEDYKESMLNDSSKYFIGEDNIFVPKFHYKVIIDIINNRSIALLMGNYNDVSVPIGEFIYSNTVSIDYLEDLTGLDFFIKLPEDIELMFEINSGPKITKKHQ